MSLKKKIAVAMVLAAVVVPTISAVSATPASAGFSCEYYTCN